MLLATDLGVSGDALSCLAFPGVLQVHYYLPNAIDFQDIFVTKQRQMEAAAKGPQQQPGAAQPRQSLGSEASLPQESSFGTSAAGVRDMLLTSNAAAAAANAAAVAEAAAADGAGSGMHWAKGGWAMEFDLSGCGAPEGEDEALLTSRGVAGNFRAVHRWEQHNQGRELDMTCQHRARFGTMLQHSKQSPEFQDLSTAAQWG